MTLHFLDFEVSSDADDRTTFDAMASVPVSSVATLLREVEQVLGWAVDHFGPPAPQEEGGEWDYQLDAVEETQVPVEVTFDLRSRSAQLGERGSAGMPRTTLTLTLTGGPAFAEAFATEFGE